MNKELSQSDYDEESNYSESIQEELIEEYRDIVDYPNYEVSNLGQVRNKSTGRILKPYEDKDGYLTVGLYLNKIKKTCKIHRLVAQAFLENPNNYNEIDHINGSPSNNNVQNLRWTSPRDNCKNRNGNNFGNQFIFIDQLPEENMNEYKQNLNKKHIDSSNKFQIGNYVQVINKREDKEKKRLRKWSEQVFQIFDKQGQTFMITPINFDMKQYKDILGSTKKDIQRYSNDLPYSQPVYRRKYYEMRISKPNDKYFPYESEDTRLYQFNKINDCVIDIKQVFHSIENLQKLQDYIGKGSKNIFYEIENDYGKFFVPLSMIRYQSNEMCDCEIEFWFGQNNKKYTLSKDQFKVFKYILYI
ncbi:Conserved_hypothetical protein [Hexamita inflata]|uniref:HNH nuclease domain-containing protein n=1 Tax=Hexamita inflata TaxID=28002 RepID=A0AA86NMY2_9EUKA|nr:Conserved hypothetical protein [Hexamita inflata]